MPRRHGEHPRQVPAPLLGERAAVLTAHAIPQAADRVTFALLNPSDLHCLPSIPFGWTSEHEQLKEEPETTGRCGASNVNLAQRHDDPIPGNPWDLPMTRDLRGSQTREPLPSDCFPQPTSPRDRTPEYRKVRPPTPESPQLFGDQVTRGARAAGGLPERGEDQHSKARVDHSLTDKTVY